MGVMWMVDGEEDDLQFIHHNSIFNNCYDYPQLYLIVFVDDGIECDELY